MEKGWRGWIGSEGPHSLPLAQSTCSWSLLGKLLGTNSFPDGSGKGSSPTNPSLAPSMDHGIPLEIPLEIPSRISSAMALCVLFSSFSSFLATSRFKSLGREQPGQDNPTARQGPPFPRKFLLFPSATAPKPAHSSVTSIPKNRQEKGIVSSPTARRVFQFHGMLRVGRVLKDQLIPTSHGIFPVFLTLRSGFPGYFQHNLKVLEPPADSNTLFPGAAFHRHSPVRFPGSQVCQILGKERRHQ